VSYLKEKTRAFSLHLLISISIIGVFLWYATSYWYPGTLFTLEQTWDGLKILIPVDAILGPLLTFILFIPHKKSLKMDLSIVGFIQLAALSYGAWVIYQQRPVMITYNFNEFEVVIASENIRSNIPAETLQEIPDQPILITYALPPQTNEELAHFVLESIPYQKQPSRQRAIRDYSDIIKNSAISLDSLSFEQVESADQLISLRNSTRQNKNIIVAPLRGSLGNYTYVAVDLKQNKIIDFININLTK